MNLYEAGVCADGSLTVGSQRLLLPADCVPDGYQGRKIIVGIRPDDLGDPVSVAGGGTAALCVDVRLVEVLGSEQHVYFAIDAAPVGSVSDVGVAGRHRR